MPRHRHRHREKIKCLKRIDAETPAALDRHLIVENYATHKSPKMKSRLERHPRLQIQFTPTSSSWLNAIERSFRALTLERIRSGVFRSVAELEAAIRGYIVHHNAKPSSFVWTKKTDDVLARVARARTSLNEIPSV